MADRVPDHSSRPGIGLDQDESAACHGAVRGAGMETRARRGGRHARVDSHHTPSALSALSRRSMGSCVLDEATIATRSAKKCPPVVVSSRTVRRTSHRSCCVTCGDVAWRCQEWVGAGRGGRIGQQQGKMPRTMEAPASYRPPASSASTADQAPCREQEGASPSCSPRSALPPV